MKNILLISLLLSLTLVACSDSGVKKSTFPEGAAKLFTEKVIPNSPGMVRSALENPESLTCAVNKAKKLFPKYANKIECASETKDYFILSLKPLKGEELKNKTPCDFSLVLYIKKGSTEFRLYWLK